MVVFRFQWIISKLISGDIITWMVGHSGQFPNSCLRVKSYFLGNGITIGRIGYLLYTKYMAVSI